MDYVTLVSIALGLLGGYEFGDLLANTWFQGNSSAALEGFLVTAAVCAGIAKAILNKIHLGIALATILAALATFRLGGPVSVWLFHHSSLTDLDLAQLAGRGGVFAAVWLVSYFVLWPLLRSGMDETAATLNRGYATAKRLGKAPETFATIENTVERGMTLDYDGTVDRNFTFSDGGRRGRTDRVRAKFQLRRNSMAMQPREREALKLWRLLVQHGGISDAEADDMKFALTWGNGTAEVYGGSFRADSRLGFKNLRDLVSAEAAQRNATTEGAIGQLFTRLHYAATRRNPDPAIVAVYKSHLPPTIDDDRSGGQWH